MSVRIETSGTGGESEGLAMALGGGYNDRLPLSSRA